MKVNLLFQYKRPELITLKLGAEWSHWNQKYFRYDIYQEQHALLVHLASKVASKALILYASPALENVNDLVDAKQRKCLIENTNFRPAIELTGHHRNTYIKAGTHSIAFSKSEQLDEFDLLVELNKLEANQNVGNKELILGFTKAVQLAVLDDPIFGEAYKSELNFYTEAKIDEFPLFFSMLSMRIFRELSGTQWLVAIENQ